MFSTFKPRESDSNPESGKKSFEIYAISRFLINLPYIISLADGVHALKLDIRTVANADDARRYTVPQLMVIDD